MVGLFRDMYRDGKDEQKKPVLSLDEIFVTRKHLDVEGGYSAQHIFNQNFYCQGGGYCR